MGSCDSSSSPTQSTAGLLGAASIGFLEGTLLDNLEKSVNVHNYDLGKLNSGEPIIVAASSVDQLTSSQREWLIKWVEEGNPVILMHPDENQLRAFQEIFGTDRTGGWAHVGNGNSHLEAYSLALGAEGSAYVGTFHPHVGTNDDEVIQDERAGNLIDWIYYELPLVVAEKEANSSTQDATVMSGNLSGIPSIYSNSSSSYQVAAYVTSCDGGDRWVNYGESVAANISFNLYPVFDTSNNDFWLAVVMNPKISGQDDYATCGDWVLCADGDQTPATCALPNAYHFVSSLGGANLDDSAPQASGQGGSKTSGISFGISAGIGKSGVSLTAGATFSESTTINLSSMSINNNDTGNEQLITFDLNGCFTNIQKDTFEAGPMAVWVYENQSGGNEVTYDTMLKVTLFPSSGQDWETTLENSCQTSVCFEGFPCNASAMPLNPSYTVVVPTVPKKTPWWKRF